MDNWRLLLALLYLSALHFLPSSCYTSVGYSRLRIDCGSSDLTIIEDGDGESEIWHTDEEFIKSGKNVLLASNQNLIVMNTLRSFPDGNKNCYELPLIISGDDDYNKYLIRAGFFYGNYDGQSRPPSFKLEMDGNLWANVTTSMSEEDPVYHELIYKLKKEQATVCLVRTSNDEVPFISSIEASAFNGGYNMYRLMENKTALYLHSRNNYGANESVEKLIGIMEEYDRIWESKEMSEYLNVTAEEILYGSLLGENNPPWALMATAIRAKNISDSIYLSVNFSTQKTEVVVAYFVLYFMDPTYFYPENQTNKVDIYIDNQKLNTTDIPLFGRADNEYSVVSLYPVRVFGSANVTISSTGNSTLAPVLNAMEVFSVMEFSVMDVSKGGRMMLGFSITFWIVLLHFCLQSFFFY